MIIHMLDELHTRVGWPYRQLCRATGLSHTRLGRWRTRLRLDQPLWQTPGPKKATPLPLETARAAVAQLRHGRHRSHGMGALYQELGDQISRRQLQRLATEMRLMCQRQRAAAQCRILWLKPGLVWSMDGADLFRCGHARLRLHNIHDLGSRYKLQPLVDTQLLGPHIARHLGVLFTQHSPPVFFKRDNGGAENHHAVNEVLAHYAVIPLNNPLYYAPYNGAMERAQREVKEAFLRHCQAALLTANSTLVWSSSAIACVHELNHQPRSCLQGATACAVFQAGQQQLREYTSQRRKEIYIWITNLTGLICEASGETNPCRYRLAQRLATEAWLELNGVIKTIHNQQNVSLH